MAIGVELIHKASVIRDDVEDDDSRRSGQASLHAAYGMAVALAASDLLWTTGLAHISQGHPPHQRAQYVGAAATTLREMAAGQMEDLSPSFDAHSPTARLAVDEQKTGALSELACRLGAMAAEAPPQHIEALATYGRKLGTAFQIVNTIRNLEGVEPERLPASDLKKRRDTVLTAHVREKEGLDIRVAPTSQRRAGLDLDDATVDQLRAEFLSFGAATFGERIANQLLSAARMQLRVLPATSARNILEQLAGESLFHVYAFGDQIPRLANSSLTG